ncbi:MAG: ABC transporter substrate-binding protein [Candidatus Binatia bacterium]
MFSRANVLFALFLSLLFFTGCKMRSPEGDRRVVDDLGNQVTIKGQVERIVSLVPTNSEMVCLLDCARLKGGTRYDRFPPELVRRIRERQVEIIGGGFDASLEKIVQIAPDLILANGPSQQRVVTSLKRLGYSVLRIWPQDLESLKRDFLVLGEILDREVKAKEILKEVERGFAAIQIKTKRKRRKTVYLQMWSDPMITVGKKSFPHWLLSAAGGINIFEDLAFDSGQVGLEWILGRDPEVLIFLTGQEAFVKRAVTRTEWKSIRAVQNGHICFVDAADIRRGVRFLDGLVKLHRCLFGTAQAGQGDPRGKP